MYWQVLLIDPLCPAVRREIVGPGMLVPLRLANYIFLTSQPKVLSPTVYGGVSASIFSGFSNVIKKRGFCSFGSFGVVMHIPQRSNRVHAIIRRQVTGGP